MPPYRLAHLNPEMHTAIENLEDEIGVTLVAYEPVGEADCESASASINDDGDVTTDGTLDTYRTFDPQIE
jgi:hypothetical protein